MLGLFWRIGDGALVNHFSNMTPDNCTQCFTRGIHLSLLEVAFSCLGVWSPCPDRLLLMKLRGLIQSLSYLK